MSIENVNIVDVVNGSIISGMDVIVRGDRIHDVVKSGTTEIDARIRVDATGQYLIPGLWDMHAKPDDPEMWKMNPSEASRDLLLPLFVLHGVTGIRDMAGSLKVVNDWREKMASGSLLGPKIFAGGPLIDGPNSIRDGSIAISSKEALIRKVDSLKETGVDFLNIHSQLPDSIFNALSKYASSIDFPFSGHLPQKIGNAEASKSGIKSLEHLLGIPLECSSKESNIRNNTIDYGGLQDRLSKYVFRTKLMVETYELRKAKALYAQFVKNDTWITPTISMWYKNAYFEEEEQNDQIYFQHLPKYMRKYWSPQVNENLRYRQEGFLEVKQILVEHYKKIINDMHEAGVKLLAGTNAGANPLCWPGRGVHLEIAMLEEAGLSPSEALKTATINPAIYLGVEEEYGTIDSGKFADMLLLSDNPLQTVSNTQNITGVIKSGSYFSKKRIEEYLEVIAERQ